MKFIYVVIGTIVILWFFDAYINSIFNPGKSFMDHIIKPSFYTLIKRFESILLIIGLGLYAQYLINKLHERERKLKRLIERQKVLSNLGYLALSENLKMLMEKTVEEVRDVLEADYVGIFSPCTDRECILNACAGFEKMDILNLKLPVRATTFVKKEDIKNFGDLWKKYKIEEGINIPIIGDECFGILGVYFKKSKKLDEGDINFLKATCTILAEACEVQKNKESLQESEHRYKQLVELSPDAIVVHSKGKIVFANSATLKMFRAEKPEDIVGKDVFSFVHPEYLGAVKKRIEYQQRMGKPVPIYEEKLIRLDGEVFFAEVAAAPIIFEGQPSSLVIIRDITERKLQEEKIKRLNHVYAILSNINSAIIRIRDRDELLKEACRITVEEGKLPLSWVCINEGGELKPYIYYGKADNLFEKIEKFKKMDISIPEIEEDNAFVCNDIENSDIDSRWKEVLLRMGFKSLLSMPVYVGNKLVCKCNFYSETKDFFHSEEIKLFEEMVADLSLALDYIEKEGEIFKLTYYDSLTGLPNRFMLKDLISHALPSIKRSGRYLAIVCIDIDNFKKINDSMGHSFGDKLLQEVANALKETVREGDIVARISGDEFCLVLSDIRKIDDISFILFKLMERFSKPINIEGMDIYISISAGISVFPNDGEDEETLLKNATIALHNAKKEAGNSYRFFTKEIDQRATREYFIELGLRDAVKKGELYLHYQPIVDVMLNKIIGIEALVRWNSGSLGFVSPGEFIPIAERTGAIVEIGHWVLKETIKQLRLWNEKGFGPLRMAINISAKQLLKKNFVPELLSILEENKILPEQIELELTETEFIERSEATINALNEIRKYGIRVAIDDFGTGYSSLGYLINFPVDTIKIDILFTRQMVEKQEYASVVKTIINMAHSMNMEVVAEGIETEYQLEFLKKHGCRYVQGYIFSPPKPPEEIEKIFEGQEVL